VRKRGSNGRKWCTKKLMAPAPAPRSRKKIILTEKPLQSQMEYFARSHSKIVLQKSICEVVATSMVNFRVV
jgi:hypothetical protein